MIYWVVEKSHVAFDARVLRKHWRNVSKYL